MCVGRSGSGLHVRASGRPTVCGPAGGWVLPSCCSGEGARAASLVTEAGMAQGPLGPQRGCVSSPACAPPGAAGGRGLTGALTGCLSSLETEACCSGHGLPGPAAPGGGPKPPPSRSTGSPRAVSLLEDLSLLRRAPPPTACYKGTSENRHPGSARGQAPSGAMWSALLMCPRARKGLQTHQSCLSPADLLPGSPSPSAGVPACNILSGVLLQDLGCRGCRQVIWEGAPNPPHGRSSSCSHSLTVRCLVQYGKGAKGPLGPVQDWAGRAQEP